MMAILLQSHLQLIAMLGFASLNPENFRYETRNDLKEATYGPVFHHRHGIDHLLYPNLLRLPAKRRKIIDPANSKSVLAKGVDESGSVDVSLDAINELTTDDPQVVALVAMENMHGVHQLLWEWLPPYNSVYLFTENTPIEVSKGKFLPKATAWHQIYLKDDPAAEIPGQWTAKMYVDDEMFDIKRFVVKEIIDPLALLRDFSSRPYPNDWGLIIGIENYSRLPKVEFARKDSLIVRDYFTRILGVPEENIIFYQDLNRIKLNRVYVFLDSCFSGVASREADMRIKGARPALFHVEKVQTPASHIISFNASSSGEISNALPEKGHGLFAYYLLRGMRGRGRYQ